MIQAPQSSYGMPQAALQTQQQYQMQPQRQAFAPSYNAVQINLDTPTLNAPPAMPYYPPVNMTPYQPQAPVAPQAPMAPQYPAAGPVSVNTPVNNTPVPQPVLPPQTNVNVQPPVNNPPETVADKAFKGLCSPDFDVQAEVMGEIAKKGIPTEGHPVNTEDLVPYVQENIVDRLTEIMNFDSSKLPGPTEQQVDLRNKLAANNQARMEAESKGQDPNSVQLPHQLSADDVAIATKLSPFEQAERNKEYAILSTAILQKTYADAIQKAGDPVPALTELPGSRAVILQLKNSPSADMAISAIDALKFVSDGRPEYKNDATTLFTIAQNDARPEVADAATQALESLNKQ